MTELHKGYTQKHTTASEAVDLHVLLLGNLFFDQKLGDVVALVPLQLQDLPHLRVLNNRPVAAVLLKQSRPHPQSTFFRAFKIRFRSRSDPSPCTVVSDFFVLRCWIRMSEASPHPTKPTNVVARSFCAEVVVINFSKRIFASVRKFQVRSYRGP